MVCDETFFRHFHKRQVHSHNHDHEKHHQHSHPKESGPTQNEHSHEHQEVIHSHPYHRDDTHHNPDAIRVGVEVYLIKNKKEELLLEDVDWFEFEDDEIFIHNVVGKERMVNARLKRVHFVERGKILIFLEN